MSEQAEQIPRDERTRDMFADGAARPQVLEQGPGARASQPAALTLPPGRQPEVVSAMEAALAGAPREELVCFTRTLLVAIRTGEPVTMRVRGEGAPRTFMVVAAEVKGGGNGCVP